MRTTLIIASLLILGCRAIEAPVARAESQPAAPGYHNEADLRAAGLKVGPEREEGRLICNSKKKCVCLEALPCQSKNDCVSFNHNIEAFKKAVKEGQGDRKVQCDRAEVGTCGPFRYFAFEGDNQRFETRWFDASGRLVAQRNWTDYAAYCEGQARTLFLGRVPRCTPMKREQVLCGTPGGPLRTPLEEFTLRPN